MVVVIHWLVAPEVRHQYDWHDSLQNPWLEDWKGKKPWGQGHKLYFIPCCWHRNTFLCYFQEWHCLWLYSWRSSQWRECEGTRDIQVRIFWAMTSLGIFKENSWSVLFVGISERHLVTLLMVLGLYRYFYIKLWKQYISDR